MLSEGDQEGAESAESTPEEELIQEIDIPENLRPRDHINQILRLDLDNEVKEAAIDKAADVILKELKRLYDTAIKPLETLYKYRDLSNRHFGGTDFFSYMKEIRFHCILRFLCLFFFSIC